jgi:hypothetical protein
MIASQALAADLLEFFELQVHFLSEACVVGRKLLIIVVSSNLRYLDA